MSEAEVIEMLNLHAANSMNAYSIFITFTFAYLTVSYFVGEKLFPQQAFIVSVLYVTSGAAFMTITILHAQSFAALVEQYPNFIYSGLWRLPWTLFTLLLAVGGIMASLYFMWNVRHPKEG